MNQKLKARMNQKLKAIADLYNINTNLFLKALDMANEAALGSRASGRITLYGSQDARR